ncbi:MAG: type II toxin-antitoxin system VapC family toxin [Desulfobacteraceae bacterium]
MSRYVVDASVMLKWVLNDNCEPDQDRARKLLDAWMKGRIELAAPSLWQYEVGNFLGRKLPQEAEGKFGLLLDLKVNSLELNENMYRLCFTWMRQNQVTFYDAVYLAVAWAIQGTLVTADAKFVNKMKKIGGLCLLQDLDSI